MSPASSMSSQVAKMKAFGILLLAFAGALATPQKNAALASRGIGRIIGGQTANAGQFPSAAAIYVGSPDGTYFCGGSLLSQLYVLSAAHCIIGGTNYRVILGSTKLSGNDPNRLTVSTSLSIIHPEFDPNTFRNDVGLVKFHIPITFTEYVQPVRLPTVPLNPGARSVAVGWGQTSDENAGIVNELNFVSVTTIPNDECQLSYTNTIFDSMVCAAGNFNEGTCRGDSGSPLMTTLNHHQWTTGVASFISTRGCESPDPSGYTRIYPYVAWITNITNSTP